MRRLLLVLLAVAGLTMLVRGALPCDAFGLQPACYVALLPGPVEDTHTLVEVGAEHAVYSSTGEFLLTTVAVEADLDLAEWLRFSVSPRVEVVPRERLFPPGQDVAEVAEHNAALMQNSQLDATIAALTELGYAVDTAFDGARIEEIQEPSAVDAGQLTEGDVIVAVDGTPVTTNSEVVDLVATRAPGDELTLTVLRGGVERRERLTLIASPDDPDQPRLGVLLSSYLALPLDIHIDAGVIGGPSAGLTFSLGILDLLGPEDLTGGEVIAGHRHHRPRGDGRPDRRHPAEDPRCHLARSGCAAGDGVPRAGREPRRGRRAAPVDRPVTLIPIVDPGRRAGGAGGPPGRSRARRGARAVGTVIARGGAATTGGWLRSRRSGHLRRRRLLRMANSGVVIPLHLAVHVLGLTVAFGLAGYAAVRRGEASVGWLGLLVGGLLLGVSHIATGALLAGDTGWPLYLRAAGYAALAVGAAGRLVGMAAVVAVAPPAAHVAAAIAGAAAALATTRGVLGRGRSVLPLAGGLALWAASDLAVRSDAGLRRGAVDRRVVVGGRVAPPAGTTVAVRPLPRLLPRGPADPGDRARVRVGAGLHHRPPARPAAPARRVDRRPRGAARGGGAARARPQRRAVRRRLARPGARGRVGRRHLHRRAGALDRRLPRHRSVVLVDADDRVVGSWNPMAVPPSRLIDADEAQIVGSALVARALTGSTVSGLVALGDGDLLAVGAAPVSPRDAEDRPQLDQLAGVLVLTRHVTDDRVVSEVQRRAGTQTTAGGRWHRRHLHPLAGGRRRGRDGARRQHPVPRGDGRRRAGVPVRCAARRRRG